VTSADLAVAGAEANLYGILAEVLAFPTHEFGHLVESGFLQMTVEKLSRELPWEVQLPAGDLGPAGLSDTALEAEYIRLFDAPDRLPTPLYTGVYSARRRDAMEEILRIYRHFGLTVSADAHDLPDFVPTMLEFLRFLAEGTALASTRESRERAMADLLERHLCPWAEHTRERLAQREALPFYQSLVSTVAVLGAARLRQLRGSYPSLAGSAAPAPHRPSR